MKESKRHLERLEKRVYGNDSERVTITMGDETLTFKNKQELSQAWIAAVIASDEEDTND